MKIKTKKVTASGWTPVHIIFQRGENRGRYTGKKRRAYQLSWNGERWAKGTCMIDLRRHCGAARADEILRQAQP